MQPAQHQPLLGQAARLGTDEILRQMPAPYSLPLERAIFEAVRLSVLYYCEGLDTLDARKTRA